VAIAALPAIGAQLLVVTSGSMAPAISAGDAVIVVETAPGDLDAGDIIAFRGYGRDRLTTHRVISRHDVGGRLHFRIQGDANAAPDPDLAPAEGVVGEAVVTLPGLGPWLLALTRPVPRLLLVVGPAVVVLQIRDLVVAQPGERRAGPAPSRSIRPPAPCR
jgi:signal peptidase